MRKLACLFLSLLLLAAAPVFAQKVLYSDFVPYDIRNSDVSIVGKVNGTLYTFRMYNNEYFLEAYDDAMNRKATIVLDFFPRKIYSVRFIPFEKQMMALYQTVSGTRITQYAALLDETGRLQKGPLKIDEKRSGFLGSSSNKEYFTSAVSENRSQIVIYSTNASRKQLEFTAYWLDPQLLKVTKRHKLKYKGGSYLTKGQALLSNNGTFYLPVYTQIGTRSFSDAYTLLSLRKEDIGFKANHLMLNDNFLEYPYQKLDNQNDRIYVGAFYSTRKNGNNDGVLYATFNATTAAFENNKFIPFDDRLRVETGTRNKQRALNDFKINQLIIKNDGGFVLAAEESIINLRTSYMPGWGFYSFYYSPVMSQTVREYHYNDILVLSYNGQGANEWHAFVRKNQFSMEDGGIFSSYSMLNTGGGLGFLFNDFNTNRSRIQLASVDANGQVSAGFLDAGGSDDPDWLPRTGKQVDAKEIVVPCLRKKQICFAKIVL
jgi:hypothetical protein